MDDHNLPPEEEDENPQSENDPDFMKRFMENLDLKGIFQSNLDAELTGESSSEQESHELSDEQIEAQKNLMDAAKRFLTASGQENTDFLNVIVDSLPPGVDVYPVVNENIQNALAHIRAMETHTEEILGAYAVAYYALSNDPRTMLLLENSDTPPRMIYSALNAISGLVHAARDSVRTLLSLYRIIMVDYINKLNRGTKKDNENNRGSLEGDMGVDG